MMFLFKVFSIICIYEFFHFFKLKKIINSNLQNYKKIIHLFKYKKVSDFRKEKLILNYSKSLLKVSIKMFILIIIVLFFLVITSRISTSFLNLAMSVYGVIEMTIIFLIYHQLRKKINAKL